MFPDEFKALVEELAVSPGEVLQMAREITHNDNLRTVDRLTKAERAELMSLLWKLKSGVCVSA